MSTKIDVLRHKLLMLGKRVVQWNDFALYTLEPDDRGRIYRYDSKGKFDSKLNSVTFEECEVREHFILAADIIPNYIPHLYVRDNPEDLLDGYDIKHLEFDVNKDFPIIGISSYLKVLVFNKFGDLRIVDCVDKKIKISDTIPLSRDDQTKTYTISNRKLSIDGGIFITPLASWSYDFKEFKLL